MQIILEDVIERIKTLINGESIYSFSKKLNISQQTVDCYVNGKRKPSLDFDSHWDCHSKNSADASKRRGSRVFSRPETCAPSVPARGARAKSAHTDMQARRSV